MDTTPTEETFGAPIFETHLQNVQCKEGDSTRLECTVAPANDSNLKIGKFNVVYKLLKVA